MEPQHAWEVGEHRSEEEEEHVDVSASSAANAGGERASSARNQLHDKALVVGLQRPGSHACKVEEDDAQLNDFRHPRV